MPDEQVVKFGEKMDLNNPVVQLCLAGAQAEFENRPAEACAQYRQAWERAADDFEACIAAHYVARCQDDPQENLRWNQEALRRAEAAGAQQVASFLPSLYLNLGHAYEINGNTAEAQRYYELAAKLGLPHQADNASRVQNEGEKKG
jgi:hypothetical protein